MTARSAEQPHFTTLDRILGAIAQLVTKYRHTSGARAEVQQCDTEEVARVAHDLGLTPNELTSLAGNGPDAAKPMDKLLAALGVDRTQRPFNEPALIRDLYRLCVVCDHKRQCAHELLAGTAAANYGSYCPNAYTVDYMIGRRH